MMKKKHTMKNSCNNLLISLSLWIFFSLPASGKEKREIYSPTANYQFANAINNKLKNSSHTLNQFFSQLNDLIQLQDSDQVISIAQVGDSHIQADFQTSVTRQLLQQYFGNAGRGLIVPLKLANTNEPRNYIISSCQEWDAIRCIHPDTFPVGIGGLTLISKDSCTQISVETVDKYIPDHWEFKNASIFYDTAHTKLQLNVNLPIQLREITSAFSEHVVFDTLLCQFDFNLVSSEEKRPVFYGLNLKNGHNGVLYHAIGINGAQYQHYAIADLFMKQLAELNNSLIIISLGTNEAYAKHLNLDQLYEYIDLTVSSVRKNSPHSAIILTTPAETWIRYRSKKRTPQPNTEKVSKVIVQYAKDNSLAYWDLFSITGGKGSAKSWRQNQLLSKDGVHFSKEGYEYIGELLFEAIYNAYREYVSETNEKLTKR